MEVLRELRKKRVYSLSQLATLTKLSKSTICDIENQKRIPRLDTIYYLAKALDVSPTYLFEMLLNDMRLD
ncbi:MAG: helix-turn-helix domain-containing protein [Oscillospiraceae bacterium]